MAKPTGSPDPQMMLVSQRQTPLWKRLLMSSLVLFLVAGGFFIAGYYQGIREKIHVLDERAELRLETEQLKQDVSQLQEQAAIHKHGSELERQASERVRKENISLQNRVSELEEAVSFYKGIMAPRKNDKGLRIERLELSSTVNKRRFKYKVVMTQVADNSSYISGSVSLNLVGVRQGVKESIPFEQLSQEQSSSGIPFKFRYFQNVDGEIVVPDEFVPEQIEVIAQSKGRKATRLEKRFDWNVLEVKGDVGKG
ncbi:DUF6776 family protein [Ketobacter alkanivorans]|uniref:Uncharacterized protein n=1 Tax=Ketobacter alkanivorans TaxID=1917421 RepID=A0A2K9LIT6_9GAMM|nr:DUF6776 family protein [Ketobacter alkanivorans]AUM12091.1 hypothetical protein Kalk_06560 [Ketobacter alkanivorans]